MTISREEVAEKSLWVSLGSISGIGPQTFCQLLRAFGSPYNIYAASLSQLKEVVSATIANAISNGANQEPAAEFTQWLAGANNHLITLADHEYPRALLEISDPPPYLYAKGNLALLNQPSIAIVGSRNASVQGEKNAEAFAYDLCQHGLCIVSGLALGIDGAAHRGALKAGGATIAVVGTGLDIVYPAKHRELAHQIAEHGLLLSEFALGTPSKPQNFPKRNRIISGLSLGCLVVEANIQSGSQITARMAAEQGREIFAIPGSIHSPMSKGCHQLIKQGAKLVDCIQDITEELKLQPRSNTLISKASASQDREIASSEQLLLDTMGFDPAPLERLVTLTGLTVAEVSSMLMLLELDGKVASLTGGQYQKIM
ncbi:DNA-processing protein DprA [Methylotenera mobilis]|uniref:DNA protecting protein DprA n=1 Tax=Methylotenera mobilis (strain JLW8 / ATCC BAA-1282 / DSM 17540) TaxID=583345 RepID=C6WT27_METML|nr:DNA-processing protein DprA [Methylotenera mobilis]ACT49089.1 DNA protecting protein DprA [Methylotenera mobilis JLW8]